MYVLIATFNAQQNEFRPVYRGFANSTSRCRGNNEEDKTDRKPIVVCKKEAEEKIRSFAASVSKSFELKAVYGDNVCCTMDDVVLHGEEPTFPNVPCERVTDERMLPMGLRSDIVCSTFSATLERMKKEHGCDEMDIPFIYNGVFQATDTIECPSENKLGIALKTLPELAGYLCEVRVHALHEADLLYTLTSILEEIIGYGFIIYGKNARCQWQLENDHEIYAQHMRGPGYYMDRDSDAHATMYPWVFSPVAKLSANGTAVPELACTSSGAGFCYTKTPFAGIIPRCIIATVVHIPIAGTCKRVYMENTCAICLDEKEPEEMSVIAKCGHSFCTECIKQFQDMGRTWRCPACRCSVAKKPKSFH